MSNCHLPQTLPANFPELLQEAIQLKREVPTRSVSQLIYILEGEGLAVPGSLKRSTLQKHLYNAGFGQKQMRKYTEGPLALILVGQTELWDQKLRLKRYAAVRQRIDINCVLPHYDRSDTQRYIASHLAYAGCQQELFTDKAIDEIFRVSTGIPRIINRICEKSLMYAFQQGKRLIDDYMIRYVEDHEMLNYSNDNQ